MGKQSEKDLFLSVGDGPLAHGRQLKAGCVRPDTSDQLLTPFDRAEGQRAAPEIERALARTNRSPEARAPNERRIGVPTKARFWRLWGEGFALVGWLKDARI